MTIYKKNNKYYCRFQIDGERHHYLCNGATSISEAKKIEDGFKYKLQQQQNGIITKKKVVKLSDLYSCFLNYSRLNKKSYYHDKKRIDVIKGYWKNKKYAEDIKPCDIERLKQKLLIDRKLCKTTVNRYLEILSKMYNLAIDNDWIKSNPIKHSAKFPIKNYQVRYLKNDEEERIMKNTDDIWQEIVIFALNTGLRESNIRLLQGKNINKEFKIIEITENKGNKHLKLPFNNKLEKLFENKNYEPNEYIFVNPRTGKPFSTSRFNHYWHIILKQSGISNLRFHDLRHTVGTRLAQNNVPVNVIKEVLAHSDISTTMRYVHTASEQLQSAINSLNT